MGMAMEMEKEMAMAMAIVIAWPVFFSTLVLLANVCGRWHVFNNMVLLAAFTLHDFQCPYHWRWRVLHVSNALPLHSTP